MAGDLGDLSSNLLVKALSGVQTSTDSGTTLGQHAQVLQSGLNTADTPLNLGDITRELLTKSQGGSVLQVSSTDLDDVLESVLLGLKSSVKLLHRGKKLLVDLNDGSNVHSGGETMANQHEERPMARMEKNSRVVGRLAHVNMVVGVNGLLATKLTTHHLDGPVGNDLVHIHVGLGAGTSLKDDEREFVDELARDDFVSGLLDVRGNIGGKAIGLVNSSGGLLEDTESLNKGGRHSLGGTA